MKIGIIACSATKLDHPAKAKELYSSSMLFDLAYRYAVKNYDKVYLWSAKHGLIDPEQVIEPYDIDIERFRAHELEELGDRVVGKIKEQIEAGAVLYLHVGEKFFPNYHLTRFMNALEDNYGLQFPMQGMGIGQQIQFYRQELGENA